MMTDFGIRQQVERTDRFIEQLRDAIDATAVDPGSLCADDQRRGLKRISATQRAPTRYSACGTSNTRPEQGPPSGASDGLAWIRTQTWTHQLAIVELTRLFSLPTGRDRARAASGSRSSP